jgi:hypothetical protein
MLGVLLQFDGLSLVPVAFVSLFLLIGLAILGYGLLSFRTYVKIRLRSPTDAHTVDSGAVEVEGEAKPGERTVEAPFTGETCIAYEFEVEKYRHDDDGSNWHTRASGAKVAPFRIADGTGVVGVEPTESSLSVDRDYRVVVGREETPPERVQAFVDGRDDLDHDTGSFDLGPVSIGTGDKHRFTERRLDPGMEAYVTGRAEPTVAVDGATPTVGDTGGGGVLGSVLSEPFVVADAGEDEVKWRYLKLGIGATLFGILFSAVPAFMLTSFLLA